MRIAHQRAVRLRRAKRTMTWDERIASDMESLRMHIYRLAKQYGAKSVAIAVTSQFRNMGHPKELRRHL